MCARCASSDDSGSPYATQWRAAVETEMEAITRAGTFLYTYQGGANNRTTTRTRWVWSSKDEGAAPALQGAHGAAWSLTRCDDRLPGGVDHGGGVSLPQPTS